MRLRSGCAAAAGTGVRCLPCDPALVWALASVCTPRPSGVADNPNPTPKPLSLTLTVTVTTTLTLTLTPTISLTLPLTHGGKANVIQLIFVDNRRA